MAPHTVLTQRGELGDHRERRPEFVDGISLQLLNRLCLVLCTHRMMAEHRMGDIFRDIEEGARK